MIANLNTMALDTLYLNGDHSVALDYVASKVAHHGRSIMYRLCSSFPYKKEFVEIFDNIAEVQVICE